MTNMKESIMYCQKYKTTTYNSSLGEWFYTHFMNHPKSSQMYDYNREIYKVKVKEREIQEKDYPDYWGWWNNKEDRFKYVFPTRGILGMVFPYAMELYVKRGDGKDYNVIIEEVEIISNV
ncbi:hypothetical protein LCGC14_2185370 [marine sediment metagenome]|uniref:Uncharacterized protein n=1 Tax=marine sediment metagenome TaxID=412755 RepID=A0A0F9GGX8_9ZZZZ